MAFQTDRGGSRRPLADINITPLVDVMLVLLIVFMVAAPLMQTGVDVRLPAAQAPAVASDKPRPILSITKDRRVFLDDVPLPSDRLAELLTSNERLRKEREVYLHADRDLPYAAVMEVMAAVRQAGVENIGLVTDPPEVQR